MAKVKFYMDSNANINSRKTSKTLDTVKDLGLEEGEWEEMTEDQKNKIAEEWAWENGLDIGFNEV